MTVINDPATDRTKVVDRLHEDLVGPRSEQECLRSRPSDVYLTGILWPTRTGTPDEQNERLAVGSSGKKETASDNEQEEVPAKSVMRPSTAGVSFSTRSKDLHIVDVEIILAIYEKVEDPDQGSLWKRVPVTIRVDDISLDQNLPRIDLSKHHPAATGAQLHIRAIDGPDCRLATVTLINNNPAGTSKDEAEARTFFQTQLSISGAKGTSLVARPSTTRLQANSDDAEALSIALLYRNVREFATGHTCSAEWPQSETDEGQEEVNYVRSAWLPSNIVPAVSSAGHRILTN